MAFTKEQLAAIDAKGRVIVSASAGSGKTTVMIEKIIRLITAGVGVDEILAVTFTNKAAAAMKEKLTGALIKEINSTTDKTRKSNLKRQLAGVTTADISTIHAYCAKLIRTHFFIAGVDSKFRIISGDDADGKALKNEALDELLFEGYESGEAEFNYLLSCYWRKKRDSDLRGVFLTCYARLRDRADYREYLERNACGYTQEHFEGVCADLLALFQEKCRYYHDKVKEERAYFTTVGADEVKSLARCNELLTWLEEYAFARDYFAAKEIEKPKLTAKSTSKKHVEHIERLDLLKKRIVKEYEDEFEGLGSLEEERAHFLSSGRTAAALAKYLLRFDEKYAALKEDRGVLDYNDLEHRALALLKNEEIAKETREKYRYVFVDEYQDVNPVQESILSLLSGDNVFLVGDIKQAIYGFRGSKSKFFAEKQKEFDGGAGQSLFMKYNFRSTCEVLSAVNKQFDLAMTPAVCSVDYERDGHMYEGGRYAANDGRVLVHFTGKEEESPQERRGVYSVKENAVPKTKERSRAARKIVEIIEQELRGFVLDANSPTGKRRVEYKDIAVLVRKNSADVAEQVAALAEAGIPVTTAAAVNVCDFTEVKALIDILSLIDNTEQDIPLCSALLSGMGGLTADELVNIRLAYKETRNFRSACKRYAFERTDGIAEKLKKFYAYLKEVRTSACVTSCGEVLAKILADTQMEASLLTRKDGRACVKRIRRFLEEAASFGGDCVHEFLEYLRNLDYAIEYSENGGEDSIKVMTMHASKGLEFPVVVLPNLSKPFRGGRQPEVFVEEEYGLAPRAFDKEKMLRYDTLLRALYRQRAERSALADELNLYYVALTRAEQRAHLLFTEPTPLPDVKYAKSFADMTDFSVWEEERQPLRQDDEEPRMENQALVSSYDEEVVNAILQAMSWEYAHTGYENLPVKSSPTQLLEDGKYIPVEPFEGERAERDTAIEEGTAYHAFLEGFDFASLTDERGAPKTRGEIEALVEEALEKTDADCRLLCKEKIVEILLNPVFYTLRDARLYKEQQFLVSLPVKDTYAKKLKNGEILQGEEEMIFQGAIDLLAVGEEVRIIDYKYSTRGAEELRAHYKPQLDLYKLAVARTLKIEKEKIHCSIINIRRGFEVDMD